MIVARAVERTALDSRSSGDWSKRVDAYFVSFDCPADPDSLKPHQWTCRFEVARGQQFAMENYESKAEALAARGFVID